MLDLKRSPMRPGLSHVPEPGVAAPLGATLCHGGVNFSMFSKHATGVELLLFDRADEAEAWRALRLDSVTNRTYHYWHIFMPGLAAGQLYGYRVHGQSEPATGMQFDSTKVLLDPYGRGVVVPEHYSRAAARRPGPTPRGR